jgi:hypothetical protein
MNRYGSLGFELSKSNMMRHESEGSTSPNIDNKHFFVKDKFAIPLVLTWLEETELGHRLCYSYERPLHEGYDKVRLRGAFGTQGVGSPLGCGIIKGTLDGSWVASEVVRVDVKRHIVLVVVGL